MIFCRRDQARILFFVFGFEFTMVESLNRKKSELGNINILAASMETPHEMQNQRNAVRVFWYELYTIKRHAPSALQLHFPPRDIPYLSRHPITQSISRTSVTWLNLETTFLSASLSSPVAMSVYVENSSLTFDEHRIHCTPLYKVGYETI